MAKNAPIWLDVAIVTCVLFKDMFNNTFRYLDDIFNIDYPEFEKHIPDIYPAELQLNKANDSNKETSFLDLNIKDIGFDIHTSVYDWNENGLFAKRMHISQIKYEFY